MFGFEKKLQSYQIQRQLSCGDLIKKIPSRMVVHDSVKTSKDNTTKEPNYGMVIQFFLNIVYVVNCYSLLRI